MLSQINNSRNRMLAAITCTAALVTAVEGAGPFRGVARQETSIDKLAKTLDKIEREFQYTGRITVKAPDVWGQARLTAHREEFENEMVKQLDQFQPNVNAEIAISDQAFLSQALSLAAAVGPRGNAAGPTDSSNNKTATSSEAGTNKTETTVVIPTIDIDKLNKLTPQPVIGEAAEGKDTSNNVIIRTNPNQLLSTDFQNQTLSIEPEILLDQRKRYLDHLHEIRRLNEGDDTTDSPGYSLNLVRLPVSILPGDHTRENYGAEVTMIAEPHITDELLPSTFRELVINDLVDQLSLPIVKLIDLYWNDFAALEAKAAKIDPTNTATGVQFDMTIDTTRQEMSDLKGRLQKALETYLQPPVPTPRERRARYPLATTQLLEIYGTEQIAVVLAAAFASRDRYTCRDRMSLTDVQSFLHNELEFAYEYLSSARCTLENDSPGATETDLWNSPGRPLSHEIRQPLTIASRRSCFFSTILPESREAPKEGMKLSVSQSPTESLAWAILLESVLLDQQLNEDIKRVSQDPNCGCLYSGQLSFMGPDPLPEARQAFVQYVKCRWPIRVFAVDPMIQQQNVADTFSLRREGQLAIALAFASGKVNAQSLTRYMRRIEQDIRTISLNNTHVGFGAGDDTFGWRFYPRVQTPDVESNIKVVGRDMIWGGPNRDAKLKQWRIEPGMRECVALMVMPSFIKHVRFDVRTNWFRLVPAAGTELFKKGETGVTMKYTMDWSRDIQSIETSMAACIKDEPLYRPGEVERLVKRAQQLSRQMPLNTMFAQVPYENTLGGFEMFSSGVTDLAPEVVGFYGAPGVDPERETTLFLVGDNFSIHDTRVVAGNELVASRLLSREVVQVSLPRHVRIDRRRKDAQPRPTSGPCAEDCNDWYVEIRLATPYGVSSPLFVPVVCCNGRAAAECCKTLYVCPPATAPVAVPAGEDSLPPAPVTSPTTSRTRSPVDARSTSFEQATSKSVVIALPIESPEAQLASYDHDLTIPAMAAGASLPKKAEINSPRECLTDQPELHWDRSRYPVRYRPVVDKDSKVTIPLANLQCAKPYSLTIFAPSDRPLPAGEVKLTMLIADAKDPGPFAVAAPLFEIPNLKVKGGQVVVDGLDFQRFHESLLNWTLQQLAPEEVGRWLAREVRIKTIVSTKEQSWEVTEELVVPISFRQ